MLEKKSVERTKKYSVYEGSAASLMLGFGEQYVVPFALRLGASSSQIGFLSAVPAFIGSLFQLLSARLAGSFNSRKRVVMLFVLFQALSFIPLFVLPFLTKSFWVLAFCFSLYLIFGNLAGPAWSSWLGDVIPVSERGKYFSYRNRVSIFFLFVSVLLSGFILTYFTNNIWLGFGVLFFFAFLGRLVSFFLFFKHSEPKYLPDIYDNDYKFMSFLFNLRKDVFGKFVFFRSFLSFAVMLASPFFAVLMLTVFNFSYVQFSVVLLTPMLIKVITMSYWGSLSNVFGNRNLLRVSSILIALIPFSWLFVSLFFKGDLLFFLIILTELFSGFAWAGMELSTFNYMLDASNPRRRIKLFAFFNVCSNFLIMLGGLIGGFLVFVFSSSFSAVNALLVVILISGFARLIVALFLMPSVSDIGNHEKIHGKRLFLDILVHRPLGFAVSTAVSSMAIIENSLSVFKTFSKRPPLSDFERSFLLKKRGFENYVVRNLVHVNFKKVKFVKRDAFNSGGAVKKNNFRSRKKVR